MSVVPVIAIVEDDEILRSIIETFLRDAGMAPWSVASAEAFYRRLVVERADVVVVDIGLPGEDGLSMIRHLDSVHQRGIIAMTARDGIADRIAGFNAGADFYLVKPVDMTELEAAIRAVLRHHPPHPEAEIVPSRARDAADAWRLHEARAALVVPDGREFALTSRETELLSCLMSNQGVMVTKHDLQRVLGSGDGDDFHRIESLLSRLRHKVEREVGLTLPVRSVFGKGMVFAAHCRIES